MAWRVGVRRTHVALWRRWLGLWLAFVAFGLVAGAHLKPRPDEIAFVLALPLAVVVPYAVGCLGLVALRAWLWPLRWLRFRLSPHQRIGKRPGP